MRNTAGSTSRRPRSGSRTSRGPTPMARHTRATSRYQRVGHSQGPASGFTLAEALIASVILAVAVVGLAGVMGATSSGSRATDADANALGVARRLMEEILGRPFDPPAAGDHVGWKNGNRLSDTYDDIADYDGYFDDVGLAMPAELGSGGGGVGGSTLGSGSTIDGSASGGNLIFHRTVHFTRSATPGGVAAPDGDFGMITVTVTPDPAGGGPVVLHRLVSRVPVAR